MKPMNEVERELLAQELDAAIASNPTLEKRINESLDSLKDADPKCTHVVIGMHLRAAGFHKLAAKMIEGYNFTLTDSGVVIKSKLGG